MVGVAATGPSTASLAEVYRALSEAYGHQPWWPAQSTFEVMVGAVLTQNTQWRNVERAIAAMREADLLTAEAIVGADAGRLATVLRPVGYFNVKARRLQALCRWVLDQGGTGALSAWPGERLREALLDVHGVGPETADDIVLYGFGFPVFVVDAYTRRLLARLGVPGLPLPRGYEQLRAAIERELPRDVEVFQQFHALIVEHSKRLCRARAPSCGRCVLVSICHHGRAEAGCDVHDAG